MEEKLPRVKPGQQFEWFQDARSVRVRLEIKGTSSKKIDVSTSDLTLKVNIQEKNYVRLFDLEHEIDYLSKEATVVYANDVLEVTLIKKEENKAWSSLVVENLSREELRQRREESFKRKEAQESAFKKQLSELKIKYDTHATREQMKQEDEQRRILDEKKKEEKERAEKEIYEGLGDTESGGQAEVVYARKEIASDIFTTDDLKKYEKELDEFEEKYPKVRQQKKVDIQFTEKIYPHVATREQHFKDAPIPKIKQGTKGSKLPSDLDNKNPLWLKDKGDEFLANKDFYSAMNAYTQAQRIDASQILCVANRSIVHLHLFNYEEAVMDSNLVLDFIKKQPKEDQQGKFARLAQKQTLRKAIALSWKGDLPEGMRLCDELLKENLEEATRAQVAQAKSLMERRQESNRQKQIGDLQFQQAEYGKAVGTYGKALETEENEIVLANMSQCFAKLSDYPKCIEFCEKAIEKVRTMIRYSNFNPSFKQSSFNSNSILMKLYLRKASSFSIMGKIQDGLATIKQALQIDELNQDARKIHEKLQKQVNKARFAELKQQAAQLVGEKQHAAALDIYNQALQLIEANDDTIDYLSILLNRCACYVHLAQYEDIISTSLRGLKIIRSYKNSILAFEDKKQSKEFREKLQSFEVRFLTRRANAYLQQQLIYNAKLDLEEAYKLDPANQQIKDDLEKLSANLK